MASLTVTRRRNYSFGKRARKTLADIPEHQSCQEWQIIDESSTPLSGSDVAATSVCCKLINMERQSHGLHALARSETLYQLARLHATTMAQEESVHHSVSDLKELQAKLQSPLVGENVQGGKTPISMHKFAMEYLEINRDNLLGADFNELGVAARRGRDGKLYLCALFR